MKKKNLITIVVAIATTSFLISCSSDDSSDNKPDVSRHERVLTITQNIDESSVSKIKREITDSWNDEESANGPRKSVLVDQGDEGLKATWEMGDKMTVYNKSYPSAGYAVVEATSTAKNTTFVGSVDCEEGDVIRMFYPAISEKSSVTDPDNTGTLTLDITSQKGTLEDIQQHYDFNYGQATVTAVTNETATANAGSTENLMAICKFTFKCDNEYLKNIKKVTITRVAPTATYTLGARNNPVLTPDYGPNSAPIRKAKSQAPEFDDQYPFGSITLKTNNLDNAVYVALFPTLTKPTFTVTTSDGVYEGELSRASLEAGKFYNVTVSLNITDDVPLSDDYVEVCGVKWARGNLQYDPVNGGDKDFMENWRIAPNQWYFVGYDKTAEFDPTTESIKDNFSWGRLGDEAFDYSMKPIEKSEYVMSGKMFYGGFGDYYLTDYYEYAVYGDVAFWASKGQYRMPTYVELMSLANASYQYGYVIENGITIYGLLLYTPQGERVTDTTSNVHFTNDDLKTGLFLPYSNRVTRKDVKVYNGTVSTTTTTIKFTPNSNLGYYVGGVTAEATANSGGPSVDYNVYSLIINKNNVAASSLIFVDNPPNSLQGTTYYYYYKIRPVLCE